MRSCAMRGTRSAHPTSVSCATAAANAVAVARSNRTGPLAEVQSAGTGLSTVESPFIFGNSDVGTPSMALFH